MADAVTNIVIAGLGGQGVIKASDILCDAAFRAGHDVKKSEVHGMSQRGGSVTSDVRYGGKVFSPMVPPGACEFLVVLEDSQVPVNQGRLRPGGTLLSTDRLYDEDAVEELQASRTLNVAMLGALSAHLTIAEADWIAAIQANLPERVHGINVDVFKRGRAAEELARAGAGRGGRLDGNEGN
jgi:indolepyruvate ferredoxin oxidoreductase, beta subunit